MQSTAQLVTQARTHAQSGQYHAARIAYRQAIAAMPRNSELLLELGVIAGQHGDLTTARRSLEKALKLNPDDANISYNLGQVAKAEDKYERAERFFRHTLQIDPTYHEALFDLGECLLLAGRSDEAIKILDKATEATPMDAMAHHVRALALEHLDKEAEAKAAYRRALHLDPMNVETKLNLAALEAKTGAPWVALELLDSLEAKNAIPSSSYGAAADILHQSGEPQRAAVYIEKCLKAGIDVNATLMTRANMAIDAGEFDKAEADLRNLISSDPAWAYQRLAAIRRLAHEAVPQIERLAGDTALSRQTRASAWFALYYLRTKSGDNESAFEALQQANDLQAAKKMPGTASQHVVSLKHIKSTFTPGFLGDRAAWGYNESGPVYVVGMPRSGTTLTEQILAAHPRIFGGGERRDVRRLVSQIAGWPAGFAAVTEVGLERLGHDLYEMISSAAGREDFFTDKTPGNYAFLGFIHSVLPQAKLIYVRRHPGDNLLSLYEQQFNFGLNYSYRLEDIAEAYQAHVSIMKHWISTCKIPIHTVDYDALVAEPEPHIRALLDFVGVEFDPRCLNPQDVERDVRTASVWQVRQPINAASSGRWRRYERQLAPYVRALEEAP